VEGCWEVMKLDGSGAIYPMNDIPNFLREVCQFLMPAFAIALPKTHLTTSIAKDSFPGLKSVRFSQIAAGELEKQMWAISVPRCSHIPHNFVRSSPI
jgi:hypothetical protein